MKYSILMPYHKRAWQLHNTLISFDYHYGDRNDYEVIIAEDVKSAKDIDEHTLLLSAITLNDNIKITHIVTGSLNGWNPAPLFNVAASKASGEFLIITSPECLHKTNILNGLDEEFRNNPDVYVVCSCESLKNCKKYISSFDEFKGDPHKWYQHSIHRNAQYHFCTALSKDNWNKVGGFDERYGEGIAYDDDDFRDTIKEAGIKIVLRDDLHTIHINHGKTHVPKEYGHLVRKNRKLYQSKWGVQC